MLVAGAVSFRMVKGMNFFLGTLVLKRTLRYSMTALLIPAYLLVMLFTFFGTVVFALEYDPRDLSGGGRVPDVATSWWMLLVTMTTVGYGDYSPQVCPRYARDITEICPRYARDMPDGLAHRAHAGRCADA